MKRQSTYWRAAAWRALVLASAISLSLAEVANAAGPCLRGINLSGAEFGDAGGTYGKNYIYPSEENIRYFSGKGMNTIRLPFRWQRLQPELGKPLSDEELTHIKDTVVLAEKYHMAIVLDPHDGAYYGKSRIGTADVSEAQFAEFWARLAAEFSGDPHVIFGLMNEPYDIAAEDWLKAANLAIRAIRAGGAENIILVPGTYWTGAHSWMSDGPLGQNAATLLKVRDPKNNLAYEVHQYFDADFSGTHAECSGGQKARQAITDVGDWARKNNRKLFLGEFGVPQDTACIADLKALLETIAKNGDVWLGWTYWVAGEWWPETEPLNVQPQKGRDRQQMATLSAAARKDVAKDAACKALTR
ncbi:glycoside hydrolase family 5 protein [Oryzifoliimicrobium ureilyticus]|uniref:glycoside hydrolase family 5 protein n=1 Tax=Oryzifoliimicrobium ureilyticus TaxID=3113724 RepID=UPI00307613E4